MNRREFLKVAGATTAVTGVTLATKPKKAFAVELGKEQDQFPNKVTKDFKGFNQKNLMFMRGFWDNTPYDDEYIKKTFGRNSPMDSLLNYVAVQYGLKNAQNDSEDKEGFRHIDKVLSLAAGSVDKHFGGMSKYTIANSPLPTHPINPLTGEIMKDQNVLVPGLFSWDNSKVDNMLSMGKPHHKFKDTKGASQYVKRAAKLFGADLVGIAPYNENTKRWTYTEWTSLNTKPFTMPDGSREFMPFDLDKLVNENKYEGFGVKTRKSDFKREAGFEPKSIIVLAFNQDYDGFKTAPSYIVNAASGVKYSAMAEVSHKLAEFLRGIGYKAIPCGNDTALSVPLAIEAGLGEGSRMGILVTEKFGPRVRLCKIYTDLELHPDKPKTFGVKEFCNVCMKCADACPGKAISHEPSKVLKEGMEFETGKVGISNISEVEKWYMNGERCLSFWSYNGSGCGTCISVCPYNKIDEWHHDLSKLMTLTPFKPLLRSLDEMFGYGGPIEPDERLESKYLKDAVNDFWNRL
ncbi:reductive dehalogenase [Tepidibacter aestuarii]|uniref:reductive dehalogenase n=1 Tax=Tepidibacter aestuarii TaxID=2925782 RepID=UPI0020BEE472|nr:reductive dehalogenase [Tepidibacter aestuarii]CAH2213406.1 epoxyqueuosine reductase [Tepidibacter aestuarii]